MKLPKIKESEFQDQVIQLAKLRGWKVAHFRTVRVQRKDGTVHYETPVQADGRGFPDLLFVRGNRIFVAELKRSGAEHPTDEQMQWLGNFNKAGVRAYCWCPLDWATIEEELA